MSSEEPPTIVGGGAAYDESDARQLVLALTIVWHRDTRRIGAVGFLAASGVSQVSRKTPPFDLAADAALSRDPFLVVADRGAVVEIRATGTRTAIEVDGQPLAQPREFPKQQVRSGIILLLGNEIVVCLHLIQVPVLRGPPLGIVGGSDVMETVRGQILRVADLESSVLIRGESGTGKELVAMAIKERSARASGPFLSLSLGTIPASTAADELFGHEKGAFTGATSARPGHFVQADGGTLFIDEVGSGLLDVQKMLLRVYETGEVIPLGGSRTRKVNVRLLAATDADLEAEARAGRFLAPLFYRLSAYQILLPPLRDRREDIGPLFLHFIRISLRNVGELDKLEPRELPKRAWLSAADVARIAANHFPGNVRTLRNVANQLVVDNRGKRHAEITEAVEAMLAGSFETNRPPESPVKAEQRTKVSDDGIRAALKASSYIVSAAAKALGIHRDTLYERARAIPGAIRNAADLSDAEILESFDRHQGRVMSMAAELRVPPKPLKARLKEALSRRRGGAKG